MTFEKTVKFDGYTADDEREEVIFETAFNPIRRIFEYEDLAEDAAKICGTIKDENEEFITAISFRARKAGKDWTSDIIGWMQGGLQSHVVLTEKSVQKRYEIAKLLHAALSRDLDPAHYGSTNKRAVQALIEAREHQISYVVKAMSILQTALFEFEAVKV